MSFFRAKYLVVFSVLFLIIIGNIYAEEDLVKTESPKVELFAEALYWYTNETMDWAFTLNSNQNSIQTAYKTFVFDWAPGFRVGLGYNMNHDCWDIQAYYTWFKSKAEEAAEGPITPAFLAARLSLLEPFSKGKACLSIDYDTLDLELGRNFSCECLAIRPFIGAKGGFISQKIDSSWQTPDFLGFLFISSTENLEQIFKGIGPKGGLQGKWYLRNSPFSLMGQLDAGYLWGHWSIKDKYTDDLNTKIQVITSDRNFGAFVLHASLGFGWDWYFKRDRYRLGLKFGYEIEDWFNHCQFFTDASGSQTNDLILQGFNLKLNFGF